MLPHVLHLAVLWEALVSGLPNQNQVANGYKLEDHEEIGALLIRTLGDRASRLLAMGLEAQTRMTKAQLPVGTFVNNPEGGTAVNALLT